MAELEESLTEAHKRRETRQYFEGKTMFRIGTKI